MQFYQLDMAWLSLVGELEGKQPRLKGVGQCDQLVLGESDAAHMLNGWIARANIIELGRMKISCFHSQLDAHVALQPDGSDDLRG